ncbi:morphogenetic protein [Serratia nevei]|uniref:morphogenetic protein n=1 Tax=Serratia nevei TaxID=2703794 RepID=UPI002542A943|nr:morphogenetic protein [Serratia nevei]WIJ63892.1 morphogenetic protein [Serratia nevei]
MKERPVIFNGEMVRAILDGRKTQTRRVVSDRHLHLIDVASQVGECYPLESGIDHANSQSYYREHCPFGQVGDRLWVRETWQGPLVDEEHLDDYRANADKFQAPEFCEYAADGGTRPEFCDLDDNTRQGWRPSIHMPRWASRITLEITAVRVERLNDISEEDAKAEGVKAGVSPGHEHMMHQVAFSELWQSIYGAENWRANPWVWVIEFKCVEVRDASK